MLYLITIWIAFVFIINNFTNYYIPDFFAYMSFVIGAMLSIFTLHQALKDGVITIKGTTLGECTGKELIWDSQITLESGETYLIHNKNIKKQINFHTENHYIGFVTCNVTIEKSLGLQNTLYKIATLKNIPDIVILDVYEEK